MSATKRVGAVVIGRNEGERLRTCLESIQAQCKQIVYVDSDSTDNSLEIALELGAIVVSLDMSTPFTAARARNEGVERLQEEFSSIQYIQFIDGDCTIEPNWVLAAADYLESNQNVAAVLGHLTEKYPEKSIYNLLCKLEWKGGAGELTDFGGFGGISMVNTVAFQQVGRFNPQVIAGEDSELGVRFGLHDYRVVKLDQPMAQHDANMLHFKQWWTRAVRAGHAIGQRAYLNGDSVLADCAKERKSTLVWGGIIPLGIFFIALLSQGLGVFLFLGYLVLFARIFQYRKKQQDSSRESAIYAAFTVLGKFANFLGLALFYKNLKQSKFHIIEYK